MNRIILFILFFIFFVNRSSAQHKADSLSRDKDTVIVPANISPVPALKATVTADTTPFVTPKKTALFSAIVPGLGQFHNKQYWKVPLIYGGVAAAIYFLNDNSKNYNLYRRVSAGWVSNDQKLKDLTPYDEGQVNQLKDYYRRNLDLTALFTALGYTLQVIDAVVFAHLKGFDISEDISLNVQPVLLPQGGLGFGLVMKF